MADNLGKLLLRLMLGGMMLFHGIDKALHGIGFIKGMMHTQGLPEALAYGVYVGEILAPIFIIIGWKSRVWAGVMFVNMAIAIYLTKLSGAASNCKNDNFVFFPSTIHPNNSYRNLIYDFVILLSIYSHKIIS